VSVHATVPLTTARAGARRPARSRSRGPGCDRSPNESYTTLLTQMAAKKGNPDRVIAATVDKAKHHVRVTLANGSRPLVSYPTSDDKQLVDNLLHNHIAVIYAKKAAVHHTLRYVAAGVVAVLLLIGGGVWFYTRGRQERGRALTHHKRLPRSGFSQFCGHRDSRRRLSWHY